MFSGEERMFYRYILKNKTIFFFTTNLFILAQEFLSRNKKNILVARKKNLRRKKFFVKENIGLSLHQEFFFAKKKKIVGVVPHSASVMLG